MPQTESLKLYPDNVIETQYIKVQNTGNELGKYFLMYIANY